MKLVTQDGRTLEISREYRLFISGYLKYRGHDATVTVTTFTKSKWDDIPYSERHKYPGYETFPDCEVVERYGVVGEYATDTGRGIAAEMLDKAWKSGATKFTMPQDIFAKSAAEQLDDLAKEHGLTLVSINELGYTPVDTARNLHIWRTTDEFERRNIIVCDPETHSYETSLAKWRALQRKSA